jgi:hypothetical protein
VSNQRARSHSGAMTAGMRGRWIGVPAKGMPCEVANARSATLKLARHGRQTRALAHCLLSVHLGPTLRVVGELHSESAESVGMQGTRA